LGVAQDRQVTVWDMGQALWVTLPIIWARAPVRARPAALRALAVDHVNRHRLPIAGPRAPRTGDRSMSLDRAVLAFAGVMILLSVVLTAFVSPLFVWFTVFIGLNMLQSAFTGWCPAAIVFKKLGVKEGCAFS
jgi:hypothetical protein